MVHVRQVMCAEHKQETVVELSNGNVTSFCYAP
jgi:hypothetical protein